MKNKILIEIRKGIIYNVAATNDNFDLFIFDHDNPQPEVEERPGDEIEIVSGTEFTKMLKEFTD